MTKGLAAQARSAIELATKGRWDEALELNRQILHRDPSDFAAWNRTAKALVQLGRYSQARDAFAETLRLDPSNSIARKNLEKLEGLSESGTGNCAVAAEVTPQQFIEDTGKSGITDLTNLGDTETVKRLVSGQPIELSVQNGKLLIYSSAGDYIGQVEPRLALRLSELIKGGNQYQGAITSAQGEQVKVMLRETKVSPEQVGKRSFPTKLADGFRPYVKSRVGLHGPRESRNWPKEYDDSEEDPLDEPVPSGIRIVDDDQKDILEEEEEEE